MGRVTVLEVIQKSTEFLTRKGVESARLQVELLLAHVLELPRLKLYLEFERVLSPEELDRLREGVQKRGQRVPLQHLLGTVSFCGYEMEVDSRVLIPRSETEQLAERAWLALTQAREGAGAGGESVVLDFGTGSGCLAILMALKCPWVRVHALDVSSAALEVARANARRHRVEDRIEFHLSAGLAGLPGDARYQLILSNPPYIPTAEMASLQPEVRDHDPRLALDGGADGLDFYRLLARECGFFLDENGRLMAEMGDGQERGVRDVFEEAGWTVEKVLPDLADRPRILVACRSV